MEFHNQLPIRQDAGTPHGVMSSHGMILFACLNRPKAFKSKPSQQFLDFRNMGRISEQVQVAAMPGVKSTIKPLRQDQPLEPKNWNSDAIQLRIQSQLLVAEKHRMSRLLPKIMLNLNVKLGI